MKLHHPKKGRIAMKSTGVVRPIDALGRLVLPIEIRNVLGIKSRDPLEIFTDGDKIILKKYQPTCIFCEETQEIVPFGDKLICRNCIKRLKEEL